jgi:hypothetical protein
MGRKRPNHSEKNTNKSEKEREIAVGEGECGAFLKKNDALWRQLPPKSVV